MKVPMSIDQVRTVWEATAPTSKLGRWFTQNYAAFSELRRPRWEAMAVTFAEAGLIEVPPEFWAKDDTPERQSARRRAGEASRQIWQRVKRQQKAAEKAAARPPIQPAPVALPRPVQSAPLPPPQFEPPAEPEPFEFRTLGRPQRKGE
jgi:hypothetical protein